MAEKLKFSDEVPDWVSDFTNTRQEELNSLYEKLEQQATAQGKTVAELFPDYTAAVDRINELGVELAGLKGIQWREAGKDPLPDDSPNATRQAMLNEYEELMDKARRGAGSRVVAAAPVKKAKAEKAPEPAPVVESLKTPQEVLDEVESLQRFAAEEIKLIDKRLKAEEKFRLAIDADPEIKALYQALTDKYARIQEFFTTMKKDKRSDPNVLMQLWGLRLSRIQALVRDIDLITNQLEDIANDLIEGIDPKERLVKAKTPAGGVEPKTKKEVVAVPAETVTERVVTEFDVKTLVAGQEIVFTTQSGNEYRITVEGAPGSLQMFIQDKRRGKKLRLDKFDEKIVPRSVFYAAEMKPGEPAVAERAVNTTPISEIKLVERVASVPEGSESIPPDEVIIGYRSHLNDLQLSASAAGIEIAAESLEISNKINALEKLQTDLKKTEQNPYAVRAALQETRQGIQTLKREVDQAFVELQRKVNGAVIAKAGGAPKAPAAVEAVPAASGPKAFALKTGESGVLLGEARRILRELAGKTPLNLADAHNLRGAAKEAWRHAKPAFDQAEAEYQRLFAAREAVRAAKTFGKNSVDDGPLRAAEAKRDEARAIYQQALAASNKFREAELNFRKSELPAQVVAAEQAYHAASSAVRSRLQAENPGLSTEMLSQMVLNDPVYKAAIDKWTRLQSATEEVARRDKIRSGREQTVVRARAEKPDGSLEGKKKSESVTFVPLEERMQVAVRRGLIDNSLAAEQKATVEAIKNNPGYWSRAKAGMMEKVTSALKTPDGKWNKGRVALVGAMALGGLSGVVITSPAILAAMPVGFAARYLAKKGAGSLGRKLFVTDKEKELGKEKEQATRDIFAGDVSSMAKSQRNLQSSIETRTKWVNRGSEVVGAAAGFAAGYGTKMGLEYGFPETFAGRAAQGATLPRDADVTVVRAAGEPPAPGGTPPPVSTGEAVRRVVPGEPRPLPTAPGATPEAAPATEFVLRPAAPLEISSERVAAAARGSAAPIVTPEATVVMPGGERIVTVQRGNVLSRLLHEQMIEAQGGSSLPPADRQRLARMMYERFPEMRGADGIRATTPVERWALTPDQWREVGVRSGNPNLIQPGERINMRRLLEVASGRPATEAVLTPPTADQVRTYEEVLPPATPPTAAEVRTYEEVLPATPPTAAEVRTYEEVLPQPPTADQVRTYEEVLPRATPPTAEEVRIYEAVSTPEQPATPPTADEVRTYEEVLPPPTVYRETPLPTDGGLDVEIIDRADAAPVTINTSAVAERIAEQNRVLVVDRASLDDAGFVRYVNEQFGSVDKFIERRETLLGEINTTKRGFLENLFSVAISDNLPVNEALPDVTLEDFMAADQSPAEIAAALREGEDPVNVDPESIKRWRDTIPQLVKKLQDLGLEVDPEETTIDELINAAAANDVSLRARRQVA